MKARLAGRYAVVAACCATFGTSNAWTQPLCGDTITTNTTLDADLLGCPGRGLRIGASNVTLDCDGHTIEALGNRVVEVNGGLTDVTVTDCVLLSEAGTDALRVQGGTSRIHITNNQVNTVRYSANGIRTLGTTDSTIAGNVISTQGPNASAIRLQSSLSNVLAENHLFTAGERGRAIRLQAASSDNLIENNVVHTTASGASAILLRSGSDKNRARRNVLRTERTQSIRVESSSGNVFDENLLQSETGWVRSRRFGVQNGGMSVHPDGRIFIVENNFGSEAGIGTAAVLGVIDPATGATIGPVRLTAAGVDIPFGLDALEITADGRFLAAGGNSNNLYEIDPLTGEVAFLQTVTSFGGTLNGLESEGEAPGVLLATTNTGNVLRVDLDAMTSTPLGTTGGPAGFGLTDIAVHPISGVVYAVSRFRSEPSATSHLYVLDLSSGPLVATEVGDTGFSTLSDVDFAPDGILYGNNATLLVTDVATAQTVSVGPFGEDPFEPPSTDTILLRTTLLAANGSGSLHYPGPLDVPDAVEVSVSTDELDISYNRVLVDSVAFPFLDEPAIASLLGLPGARRVVLVDEDGDGEFERCSNRQCRILAYAGGTLVFKVRGFTTYTSAECPPHHGRGWTGSGASRHCKPTPPHHKHIWHWLKGKPW